MLSRLSGAEDRQLHMIEALNERHKVRWRGNSVITRGSAVLAGGISLLITAHLLGRARPAVASIRLP